MEQKQYWVCGWMSGTHFEVLKDCPVEQCGVQFILGFLNKQYKKLFISKLLSCCDTPDWNAFKTEAWWTLNKVRFMPFSCYPILHLLFCIARLSLCFFITRQNLLKVKQLKATHIVVSDDGVWRTKCFQSDWKSLNERAATVLAGDPFALSSPKQQSSQQRKQEEPKQEHSRRSRHAGVNPFVSLQLNPRGEEKWRKAERCLFIGQKISSHLEVCEHLLENWLLILYF